MALESECWDAPVVAAKRQPSADWSIKYEADELPIHLHVQRLVTHCANAAVWGLLIRVYCAAGNVVGST